ncbi:RimJ/RimL family protein N-acetyltransferase [Lederbergia galactosidilyticus]|uniref:GNAT family N-acetyltransferase n=1 Tax=Lederbergia galactosidilytica TaxID=217031 RepID=UPI001AE2682A|nr:GNAT family N-acetyltransferase [Lederbergia galactosidilytica]MBP1916630.1 RimJ/RimL family protein N-acetyltransferase [Lederbergia galactosidilytica]
MLKKRELNGHECQVLYELMMHPDVFPYVRQKVYSFEEFLFSTKQTIEAEDRGELYSRTILDEWENPIGTINLFDVSDGAGFLGTWIGKPYHGKGYNSLVKELFLQELFFEKEIETVYMRIKVENHRSRKAAEKLSYVLKANKTKPLVFQQLNPTCHIYDLYEIPRDLFTMHYMREMETQTSLQQLEA